MLAHSHRGTGISYTHEGSHIHTHDGVLSLGNGKWFRPLCFRPSGSSCLEPGREKYSETVCGQGEVLQSVSSFCHGHRRGGGQPESQLLILRVHVPQI